MRELLLIHGDVSLVDDEDYSNVSKYRWYAFLSGHNIYAKTFINKKSIFLHRMIANAMGLPVLEGMHIDHINCNGLDNRRVNIRLVSFQHNQANCRKIKIASSLYKGVSKRKDRNKWEAYIKVNRIKINIGTFTSEVEAAKAYNQAAIKHFGEFARINII